MKRAWWPVAAIVGLLIVGGAVLTLQWQRTAQLRDEIALLREEDATIEQLRSENRRLKAQQVGAAELERLRTDHAAIPRLRAEIEALKAKLPPAR